MSLENGMPHSSWTGDVSRNFRENPIHESVHVPEMYQIANEVVDKRVPELVNQQCASLINEAVQSMIGAIHYDIDTIAEIHCKDLNSMFSSSKARRYVSDAITQAIIKQLQDVKLKL